MNPRLVMSLAACVWLAACTREQESEQAAVTVQSNACPLEPEVVAQILGKPVHIPRTPVRLLDACTYRLDGDSTIEVDLSIKPAEVGETLFAGLRQRMEARLGAGSQPEAVTLGDEGWAYESASGSEAAARKGEKVYHATIASFVGDPTPRHKAEMIRLVGAMITGKE